MINCPITQQPLEQFYKYVFRSIKDRLDNNKTFDINKFMENLFNEIEQKSDTETAAKWLQSTPRVISLIITKSFSNKIPLVKGLENVFTLMADFSKPEGEGFQNVLKKYSKPSVNRADIKSTVAHQTNTEFATEENEEEDLPVEGKPLSPRLKTPVALSGTLPAFVPVDPEKKSETFIEQLDEPRAKISANIERLNLAFNMHNPFDGDFVYQDEIIKVKAVNLYTFSQQHFNELDPQTQKEIKDSEGLRLSRRTQAGVSQTDQRVILVITNQSGENLYFDEEGNITNKSQGNLVYQFMRDVRKTPTGYVVTDIYGREDQLMPIEDYAKQNYDKDVDGDYNLYLKNVKADREKELKKLFELREKALSNEVRLDFLGTSQGVSSDLTATKLPLYDFLKIPGTNKKDLKNIRTLGKPEGRFEQGVALLTLNDKDFQVKRSSMPNDIADQIAAVMFDPNLSFEIKKDFYFQFIPEDKSIKLAYTMRKHEIIPDADKQTFRIKIYDEVGTKNGFVTKPKYDFTISKSVLSKSSPETLAKGIEELSNALKTGRSNGKATYMSYKNDLLNNEDYLVYNLNTKQMEIGNYIEFLTTLDGYVMLVDADPGFYNKHILFGEPTRLSNELNNAKRRKTFEEELNESRQFSEKKKALENANKSPIEIEAELLIAKALDPAFKASLEEQGQIGKYNSYYYTASLVQGINNNFRTRYTREVAEQLRDIFVGSKLISGKQIDTVNDAINEAFPEASPEQINKAEIAQKTIEPEMPNPDVVAPKTKKGLLARAPKKGTLDRAGYIADEIGQEDLDKVLDWWDNTKLGKELQKHIKLQHAYNLVNSDVFAKFVVNGATLTNPDIIGEIQINPAKGTLVDIYHEAWHGFTQLYLTRSEKYGLYNEVINYKDAEGNQPYKSLSYRDIDELLAEDFRTYMKSNYIKKGSPMRNSLFRKIMNFLRALFGKKPVNPTEIITDTMNIPAVRELFEKLNYSSNKNSFVRKYQANIDNVDFFELNRGIRKLNRPSDTALSVQDSQLVSDTMDMIISDIIDEYYRGRLEEAKETGKYTSLKSGTLGLLLDPDYRSWTYSEIKISLEDKLEEFKEKLRKEPGITPFSQIKKLESKVPGEKTIESEAIAVLKSAKGEDKYVFLKSQIDGFDNLNPEMKKGDRVKGESWHGIKIVGDFYSHKELKKNGKPVGIIIVSNVEDARLQYDNYIAGKAQEYTEFIEKSVPEYELSAEQELILDNIRILQAALDNYGDPEWEIKGIEPTGTIAYHLENSDFEISKKKYFLDKDDFDEEGEEIDEEKQNETHDSETPFGGEAGNKKSLLQLASKEVVYVLKSLHKVDREGNVSYNRLGFKERADFRKVWNIVTKTIGGERDRVKAFEALQKEAKNFPELAQLIETKFPDPRLITNLFEQKISISFYQTFSRPSVKYWQFTVFPQYEERMDMLSGYPIDALVGFEADVTQSSIEVDSIVRKFEANFKTSLPTKYINKNSDNQSTLNLETLFKDFESKKNKGQLDVDKAFDFAAAMGIKLDDLPIIKDNLKKRFEFYGLPYIYDIVRDFYELQNLTTRTQKQSDFLESFIGNPIATLRKEIPQGVLKSFKKDVLEKNILKRLAELQAKYGYDSANPGVLLPDGNRVFENVNHSQVTVTVDAINKVSNLEDFWTKPEYQYMSHLRPGKSYFTLRSKLLGAMFDTSNGTFDAKGDKVLELIQTAGTQVADVDGINTADLDKYGKFFQEFHTFMLGGIAEFIRHAEKKSAFGIRQKGGKMKIVTNGVTNGVDQNLYIDVNKFFQSFDENMTNGELVAVGGYFLDYIAVEFDRIRYFKQNPDVLKTIKGYNREIKDDNGKVIGRAGEFFTFFDNILTESTKKDLYELTSDPVVDIPTYIKNNQKLYLKVQKDIIEYFKEKADNITGQYYSKIPYVDSKVLDKAGITQKDLDKNPEIVRNLMKAYLYNDWIHKFETFNLINGDGAQFNHDKQEASKRAPGSTSDGDGFVNDQYMHTFIDKIFNNNTYAKKVAKDTGKNLDKFVMNGTLNTGVIADAKRKSIYLDEYLQAWEETYRKYLTPIIKDKKKLEEEIKRRLAKDAEPYEKMTESDGAAFITFDAYRTLKFINDDWSIPQEELYQQIVRGEKVDPLKVKEFFPIYKLHYYGSIANAPIATTGMHKFAVTPILPTVATPGTEMYKLHIKMLEDNLQYITFGSGSKVSTLTMEGDFDNIFGDSMQKSVSMDAPIMKNVIYLEYLKDVTKVSAKLKNQITLPTQKRVLLLDGLYDGGELINPSHKDIAESYKNAVDNHTEALTLELLNKIGYKFDKKTGKYVGKLDKFIELIRDELGAREIPEHLIKLLDTSLSGHLSMDFSIHPEADTLEKIIVNRIQKSVIKQKTKGEALVQAPSTFYNGIWDEGFKVLKDPKLIKKYLGSNILPFYRRGELRPDGTRENTSAMKIAMALNGDFLNLLKLKHTDGEPINTIDRLNQAIKDDKWLEEHRDKVTIAGPRIPTDAANVIEFAEVWHFLDSSLGNTVIVPSEIVAKAGSDFDVDKIFFMMPHLNSDGSLVEKPAENIEELTKMVDEASSMSKAERKKKGVKNPQALIEQYKKHAQNELIIKTRDILSLPENFTSLTKPNNTYLVEDEVEFYDKNSSGYNNKNNAHKEAVRKNDGKPVMSPSRVLDIEYNLSVHEANLSGNTPLGILAKKNKSHALFKSIGALMPKAYKATMWNDVSKKYDEIDAYYDVVIRMAHKKISNSKGEEVVSLSDEVNVDGEKIGDIFSHGLQGILDRAKNPFPFKLQIVKEAISTINHLIEAGSSIPTIFAFINNPWIVKYIETQKYLGGSLALVQDDKILSSQIKSKSMQYVINDMIAAGGDSMRKTVNDLITYANDRRLFDMIDILKKEDKDKTYIFRIIQEDGKLSNPMTATGKRIFHSKNFPLDKISVLKEYNPSRTFDEQKTLFNKSAGLATNDNYYYAAEAAWNRAFPNNEELTEEFLKDKVIEGPKSDIQNLAILLHMVQLEKQFSGMDSLEMAFTPDTGLLDTVLQIKKRDDAFKMFDESSKIDSDFLNRLRHKSILSSFYKSGMILDLVVPLFPLRLNEKIINYVDSVLTRRKQEISQKFGPGIKGQERFTNMYNNAVVNYIFQNVMSNFTDANNKPVKLPEVIHSFPVVEVTTGPAVTFTENSVKINLNEARSQFGNSVFLTNNNTPDGYKALNKDAFDYNKNPFPNFSSYLKFIVEKEYLKTIYPKDSLSKNPDFINFVNLSNSEDLGYDKWLTQEALMRSGNRAFIMGTTKYSYTAMVMNIINEFESQNIKENFPITAQIAPAKFVKDANVIELGDRGLLKGVLAEDYAKNLKQLSDPTVRKVRYSDKELDKLNNQRITDVFKHFSLFMFYQHGAGYSRLGFVKALDPEGWTSIMQKAANSFLTEDLNEEFFDDIYNTLISKGQFKNYIRDPHGVIAQETPADNFFDTFSDDDWEMLSMFMERPEKSLEEPVGVASAPVSQTNKPKGVQVKEGIYVNQGALTKEEQLELFNYLKPYLEEQAAKTNKGAQASKMIGLGLRWDYKNNNVGRKALDIPDVINPGNRTKYGYYDQSINGQPLGQITPRFRELMQKATGVDMTNYDGAIINLYEKDTFISSHNDVDESKSAIKYPVIGINIGGKGNFSIERLGPESEMLELQAGTGYIFGVDGINREVWHRTFPTPQDSFLPELTTKIDGKTYPAGSYRITITMRRVMPLTQGMPEAPSIVSTQPTQATGLPGPETKINIYAGTGENAELSNFAVRPFTLSLDDLMENKIETTQGDTYTSVEQAFQVMKYHYLNWNTAAPANSKEQQDALDAVIREIEKTTDSATIKKLGRKVNLSKEQIAAWDKVSSKYMKDFITQSFKQNSDALAKLLATGNATLTHTQDKTKWGTEFPKLLMEVRDELRATQPTVQPVGAVKEGVEELFESNPELANAVYEALEFKQNNNMFELSKEVQKELDNTNNSDDFKYNDKIETAFIVEIDEKERQKLIEKLIVKKGLLITGQPVKLNAYHGTFQDIDAYLDLEKSGLELGEEGTDSYKKGVKYSKPAVFATSSKEIAETYSKNDFGKKVGKVENVIVDFKNPLVINARNTSQTTVLLINSAIIYASENGYDSVIIKNINDSKNEDWDLGVANTYIGLNSKTIGKEPTSQITPQQKQKALQLYSQYLDTIFPDSKVKDIVYRGGEGSISEEQYYTLQKKYAERYGKVVPTILNLSNPVVADRGIHRSWVKDEITNRGIIGKDYPGSTSDAVIEQMNGEEPFSAKGEFDVYVIKNENQKHILGSKQDIEGFKEFVSTQPVAQPTKQFSNEAIENFYNSISEEEKNKLGTLDDLIMRYENSVFDYPVEQYIESLKCK